ncbi:MAG TPA: Calx-beta domain-containing protein, partial [Verrucomicrobiae bacterium]|nr:Calx-beta domain-containing protein [Verrucomicrobiae bacterium]
MLNETAITVNNMAKEIMKKFTSPGLRNLKGGASFLILTLMVLVGLMMNVGKAQDSFSTPQVLVGDSGTVSNDNSLAVADIGAPSTAGFPPNKPLWYQWTAPSDGEVALDTIGSTTLFTNVIFSGFGTNFIPIFTTNIVAANFDTVLAVYSGTSLTMLNQVAANDDLFPISLSTFPQYNESGSADYIGLSHFGFGSPLIEYNLPYYGSSGLRFNAKGGTTYYFAVDTKTPATGTLSLSWTYKPSGVFRFASEDIDPTTGLPLYQTAQTESQPPEGLTAAQNSTVLTYYTYNAPGALVTVTRPAGSTGRVTVDYSTEDGTSLITLPSNDAPAVAGIDYAPVSGTLVFDDFEMSKTILIPILNGSGDVFSNTVFAVTLTNAQLDPLESGDVAPPRVDPIFGTAMVRILNVNADPYGPDMGQLVSTNGFADAPTNTIPNLVTNIVMIPATNAIFSFEKANYRVPEDVNDGTVSPWTQVTIYVERFGTNYAAETLHYRINNYLTDDTDGDEEQNIYYPL